MRFLAAVLLALVVAACGEEERGSASGADPDQPVQAPAVHEPPAGKPAKPAQCRRVSRRLEGRTLAAAQRLVERKRCALRVVVQDGRSLPVTDDYSPTRINVHVADGRVTKVAGRY